MIGKEGGAVIEKGGLFAFKGKINARVAMWRGVHTNPLLRVFKEPFTHYGIPL